MVSIKSLLLSGLLATSSLAAPVEQKNNEPRLFGGHDKRGLAFNDESIFTGFLGKLAFGWSYNWAATGPSSGPEFVPMLWGTKMFGEWPGAIEQSLASGAKNILGFNEPDLAAQANMSPQEAADAWKIHMNPYAGRAKLGSPGVTSDQSGGEKGLGWLRSFFDACGGQCTVDFLAIHWYGPASNVENFKNHVREAVELARSQGINDVWVTEFRGEGEGELKFVAEVLPWLDNEPGVARYAYFMVDEIANTEVGQAYSESG